MASLLQLSVTPLVINDLKDMNIVSSLFDLLWNLIGLGSRSFRVELTVSTTRGATLV